MMTGRKLGLALLVSSVLMGCMANPTRPVSYDLSVTDRAAKINEAFYQELNGQILKNILRARDRQPRFYTSLSDLKITPSAKRTVNPGLPGVALGNYSEPIAGMASAFNPWGSLSPSLSFDDSSNLELTISPKATAGDSKNPIYHSVISLGMFLNYFNDWDPKAVDNLLVNEVISINPLDQIVSNNDRPTTLNFVDKINAQSSSGFKVFLGVSPRQNVNLSGTGDGAFAFYCFSAADCKKESSAKTTETPETTFTADKGLITTVKTETSGENVYELYGSNLTVLKSQPPNPNLNEDKNKLINLRHGSLFVCEPMDVKYKVSNSTTVETTTIPKSVKMHDCRNALAATLKSQSNPVLIYVSNGEATDGSITQPKGVYRLSLNTIDNAIYRIGSNLRPDGSSWVATLETTDSANPFELFRVDSLNRISGHLKNCQNSFAAQAHHNGNTYVSGPPELTSVLEGYRSQLPCYKDDESGTMLTLISEIIKLNEVNAELQTSSVVFTR